MRAQAVEEANVRTAGETDVRTAGRDAGQETVGHALLITVAAAGALAMTRLSSVMVAAFESFRLPLG